MRTVTFDHSFRHKSILSLVLFLILFESVGISQDQNHIGVAVPVVENYRSLFRKSPTLVIKNVMPKNSVSPMAFFCRMESKWEKKGGHGIKFRLGDINHVNYLEGKTTLDQTGFLHR